MCTCTFSSTLYDPSTEIENVTFSCYRSRFGGLLGFSFCRAEVRIQASHPDSGSEHPCTNKLTGKRWSFGLKHFLCSQGLTLCCGLSSDIQLVYFSIVKSLVKYDTLGLS